MKKRITLRGRFLRTLAIFTILTLLLWFGYHLINYAAVRRIAEESARLAAENLTGQISMSNNRALEGMPADILPESYEMVAAAPAEGTPLSIAAAIQADALFPGSAMFLTISLVFIGMMVLEIAVLYRYLSRDMIRPMASVVAGVASLDGGTRKRLPEMSVLGKPDFQSLVLNINDMLERTEKHNAELISERQKVFDAELARQKMRMGMLASQIDAHFVTNALIGIKSLAVRGDNEQAAQMAGGLGYLLKHRHKGDEPVNVFEEFMALEKYIEVMNIRHGGKFSFDYDLDDSMSKYLMPGFILQPIVENALEHGLGNKEQDARLFIKGLIQDDRILIEISDNGAGIPPAKLKSIKDNLTGAEPRDFPEPGLHGVALMNVQRRIRLQFGNEYGVNIESDFGKGTTATLSFPLVPDQEGGDAL